MAPSGWPRAVDFPRRRRRRKRERTEKRGWGRRGMVIFAESEPLQLVGDPRKSVGSCLHERGYVLTINVIGAT